MKRTRVRRKKQSREKKDSPAWLRSWLRMIGISFVFGLALFTLAIGAERLAASSAFRVEGIAWHGLAHLDADEMTARYQSVLGKNIFRVDIREIHERLMHERWIKAATVKKDFPNRLVIFVVERKPAAVGYRFDPQGEGWIDTQVAPVLIDRKGFILKKGGPFPPGLARLIHVNATAYDKALALWARLGDRPGAFIDLRNPDDLLVYLSREEDGRRLGLLHLGGEHFAERWERYLSIEAQLRESQDLDRNAKKDGEPQTWEVDLRFPGQAIVKNGHGRIQTVSDSVKTSIYF